MDPLTDDVDNERDCVPSSNDASFRLRSYQAEMVEASLSSNIIVAMDTGSGKTSIALERARIELETCSPDQIVWFLAPTVTLCEQQYEVFKAHLPGFSVQVLSGDDGVDRWSEQSTWDAVLKTRITISTHKVLLDALTHGFVKISKLALLIFDEAHHCTKNHPAHRIMSDFYTRSSDSLPRILGLSASPVKTAAATTAELQQLEENLQALTKTPTIHRSDLIQYVHRPQISRVLYKVGTETVVRSDLYLALHGIYLNYDIMKDPFVCDLLEQQKKGYDVSQALQKVLTSRKTYCNDQLKTLVSKARDIANELGLSAMEWYLHQCMAKFETMINVSDQQVLDLSPDEKIYLLRVLRTLPWKANILHQPVDLSQVSNKVDILIDTLITEIQGNCEFTALVFVEQRVWIAALANILSTHPQTKELFRIGTYVGTSKSNKRKGFIAAFAEPKNQQATLNEFRTGMINLILATSVLEEGIDISSCHLVIDFQGPTNLKSFVQRRGRARKQRSKYFILLPDTGVAKSSVSWESLESAMKASYENDMRVVEQAKKKEQEDEHGERYFEVPSSGALLTLDNAMQHLNHFCASLRSGAYVNAAPQYEFFEEAQSGQVTARVSLPISVDPTLRTAISLESWRTERLSRKDAAFEAYKALYLAGLVNDNLLPLRQEADEQIALCQLPDYRPSMVPISQTFDPWPVVAQHQRENPRIWYRSLIEVHTSEEATIRMILYTPGPMPTIQKIPLHWNKSTLYHAHTSWLSETVLEDEEVHVLRSITWKVLRSIFQVEEGRGDFLWLLAPCDAGGLSLDRETISNWQHSTEGDQPAVDRVRGGHHSVKGWGLVMHQNQKYMLQSLSYPQTPHSHYPEETLLQLTRLPKRRDFLHSVPENENKNDAYTTVGDFPAVECTVSNLPRSYSIFALLLPSVIYRFEVHMIADVLRSTLLKPVSFEAHHLPVLVTAITSPATGEEDNYERLEFLGDTILKFVASIHLMAKNLNWPESYLTGTKGRLVSNAFLSRAALASGLDQFIITKRFTGAKWRPRYVSQIVPATASVQKEEKSSKLVADIIESLIGASYMVGGIQKAYSCIQTLLPLENWTPVDAATQRLQEAAPILHTPCNLNLLEGIVGRTFTKKSLLLEALTHASYNGPNACPYERLEFLGDAVLDYIITKRLMNWELSHQTMHQVKSAMVTASFLAYSMFELTVAEETTNKLTLQPEVHHRALWQFLRGENQQLVTARDVALRQHMDTRDQIAAALDHEALYPWHLLALCDAPKFLSDIVESVIGAVYVDSCGDVAACESFIRRLGILDRLDRIVREGVDVVHPKVRLGILAVEKNVKYLRVMDELGVHENSIRMYKCRVVVGGKEIGGVVEGLKKANAETIAAWRAATILEQGEDMDVDDVFFDAEEGAV